MLVNTLDDHCDSSLYIVMHHLLDHMVEDIRTYRTQSVLDSMLYEQFNVHVKHAYNRASQKNTNLYDRNGRRIREKV